MTISLERFAACPGACINDTTRRIPSLVKPGDHHSFLLFHIATTEATTRRLENIKRDFISLGKILKGAGAQAVFSSILSAEDWGPRRRKHMNQVNDWLCSWCNVLGFIFCMTK